MSDQQKQYVVAALLGVILLILAGLLLWGLVKAVLWALAALKAVEGTGVGMSEAEETCAKCEGCGRPWTACRCGNPPCD